MNVRRSSLFSSTASRSATSGWRGGHLPNNQLLLFAAGIVASFWAAATCNAQIQANAYISNNLSTNVSVIDTETKAVIGTPITVGTQPFGVATTPDGRFVYVANVVSNSVSVIVAATNQLSSTISAGIGSTPFGVAVTPDAKFAYVSNSGAGTVSVIDTATNTVVGPPITVGTTPFGVAVNGAFAYVANNGSNTVSVINTATNTVVLPAINVGVQPQGVAVSPDGQFVYVTNLISQTVSKISTATNTVVATILVPFAPGTVAVNPNGNSVYVTNQNNASVSVIDTTTNQVVGVPISVGNAPFGVSATPDGASVYVTNRNDNTISVIDTATNTVTAIIPVGTKPAGFGSFVGPNIIVAPGGPLSIANDAALTPLGFGTFVDFNGGTLQTTGPLNSARTISLLTLGGTIDTNGFNSTLSGNIINSGALIKSGLGTLTLSGTNTYTGGTSIVGGILSVSSDSNLGTFDLTIANNAELLTTGTTFTSLKLIGLGAGGGTLASATSTTATYGGVISGTSRLSIGDGTNQGTIVLSGLNTYTGGTTINNGAVLQISSDNDMGNGGGLTFNGGILQTTASFTSARAILLNALGGIFEPDTAITFTENGAITGGGGLTKDGAGTLILGSVNGYTGGTIVQAGNLQAGAAGAFVNNTAFTVNGGTLDLNNFALTTSSLNGAGGVVNLGSATLTIDDAGTDLYSGVIQGTGSLTKIGAGTQTLSGINTYSGGTAVDGGILQISADANLGAATGPLTFDGGTLETSATFSSSRAITLDAGGGTFEPNAATTFSIVGAINGIGGLTENGGGTVVLGGIDGYTGGTTVLAGTLQAGSAGGFVNNTAYTVNGGTLDLNSFSLTMSSLNGTGGTVNLGSAALTINDAGTDLYSGIIQGTGSLIKTGTGTLALSGNNTYSGGTVLNAGTLTVNGPQALGLGNVVLNGGILNADPQPINVKGNYTQNAGATLQLQVAGANPGQYDTLNVGGNAALGGTLQLISLGFAPVAGNQLKLVTTGGVVSSRFAQFVNPFATGPGFNTVDLVYARQSVTLEFLELATPVIPLPPGVPGTPTTPPVIITTDFSSFAFTPNQLAAASLLDAVQLDSRAANLISFLNTEPFSNLPNDLQKISPDGLNAFYEISFSNANIQKLNLESRFDDIHNGSNGFSSNMKVNGATVNDKESADGKSSKAVAEPILQPGPQNRWGVWVTGFGDFVNVDGDGNGRSYDFTTGGVSLGIDFRITDQLAIGVMGDYSHTWTSLNPGHIDVDSGRGGLYATWFNHGLYLNGAIYGGHNNYESGRSGLGGLANGSTEGAEWSTFIGGGYDFHFGPLTVGAIASLQYTDVGVDSFNEKGSLAPLAIHSDSAESLRSDVGFRLFYQWQIGKIVVEPSIKAAWEHEYKYSALPITAGFAGIPGPTSTFFGPSEGHDSAVISAGVSVQITPSITTYLNYDGQLGRENYDSNAVTGGVRISF